jgi:hypothetical protein
MSDTPIAEKEFFEVDVDNLNEGEGKLRKLSKLV